MIAVVPCIKCGKPYDFYARWNEAGASRFGAHVCSNQCWDELSQLSEDEQMALAKKPVIVLLNIGEEGLEMAEAKKHL